MDQRGSLIDGLLAVDVGVGAAVVTVVGAISVFIGGEYLRVRRDRLERRRAVLESWLRALAEWVADFQTTGKAPDRSFVGIVNADVLALSLSSRDAIVAYWMDEMIVELRATATQETGLDDDSQAHAARVSQASFVVSGIGSSLAAWHSGVLKPQHFWVPYKLRRFARTNGLSLHQVAREHHLPAQPMPYRHGIRDTAAMLIMVATRDTYWLFVPAFGPLATSIAQASQFKKPEWWLPSALVRVMPRWHRDLERNLSHRVRTALRGPSDTLVARIWRSNEL